MSIPSVLNSPWAIEPEKLVEISEIYLRHVRGEQVDIAGFEAQLDKPLDNKPIGYRLIEGVAVLPIEGVIAKRMNMFTRISGGVSSQLLLADIAAAVSDPLAHSILLLIDSPGGQVDGTQAVADAIRSARSTKPIYALADGRMASAAYWIGSAAEKVFIASDTTAVGSIGVVMTHLDYSKAQEQRGVKVTDITAGKYKRIASENAPLSDEGRASLQAIVDHIYSVFVDAVAHNRGVSTGTVLKKMADGRVFLGQQAIDAGLVDGISSMSNIIQQLNQRRSKSSPATAAADGLRASQIVAAKPALSAKEPPRMFQPALKPVQAPPSAAGQQATVVPRTLADRISDYVMEQRKLDNRVSYAEALAHVERQGVGGASTLAARITDYVAGQRQLGNRVTCAEAAAHIEAEHEHTPRALAIKISEYVEKQRKLGNRITYAEAAAVVGAQPSRQFSGAEWRL